MRYLLAVCFSLGLFAQSAFAQGLLWSLPEDGKSVSYRGTLTQTDIQANITDNQDVTSTWDRELTIKSVGTSNETVDGESVSCRWIEFRLATGKRPDADLEPGPVGVTIYKVLVPEKSVIGKVTDENGLFVSYLPVVKGYRKLGDANVEELQSNVLQVYPMISYVMHYREMTSGGMDAPESPLTGSAEKFTCEKMIENTGTRLINKATLWRSDEVPFGLAKWSVTQTRERKPDTDPRSNYEKTSELTVTMTAQSSGDGAQSDLPDSN